MHSPTVTVHLHDVHRFSSDTDSFIWSLTICVDYTHRYVLHLLRHKGSQVSLGPKSPTDLVPFCWWVLYLKNGIDSKTCLIETAMFFSKRITGKTCPMTDSHGTKGIFTYPFFPQRSLSRDESGRVGTSGFSCARAVQQNKWSWKKGEIHSPRNQQTDLFHFFLFHLNLAWNVWTVLAIYWSHLLGLG